MESANIEEMNEIETCEREYQRLKDTKGEKDPETIEALDDLAVTYSEENRNREAANAYLHLYELRMEALGETHDDTMFALLWAGQQSASCGEYEQARELCIKFEKLYRKIHGENYEDEFNSVNTFFWELKARFDDENYEDALECFKLIYVLVDIREELDREYLENLDSWAKGFEAHGRYREALESYELVYEGRKKTLGETDEDTMVSLEDLARSYSKIGKNEKSLELYEKLWDLEPDSMNKRDWYRLLCALAIAHHKCGHYDKALELFEEVYNYLDC